MSRMSLQQELELSVEVAKMTDDPGQRRILMDKARSLFTREHEQCAEDESCLRTTVGYCTQCRLYYCSEHIAGPHFGQKLLCQACHDEIERDLEEAYGTDPGDKEWVGA